ncbi:MAG: hypothetical protein V4724_24415 [Pseudomonadota bacterium]
MDNSTLLGRSNLAMAAIVEIGLLVAPVRGRNYAANFMDRFHVPLPVIARVLDAPHQRRPLPRPEMLAEAAAIQAAEPPQPASN